MDEESDNLRFVLMPNHCALHLIFLVILLAFVTPGSADIIKGIGVLEQGCWDFSEQKSIPWWEGADACIAYVVDPPLGWRVGTANYATVAVIDSTFDDVTTAPEDSSAYAYDCPVDFVHTYVVHTAEGHYAKFHILQFIPLVAIEYAYQSDGSRNLDTGVPVDATSWGRIKALYR